MLLLFQTPSLQKLKAIRSGVLSTLKDILSAPPTPIRSLLFYMALNKSQKRLLSLYATKDPSMSTSNRTSYYLSTPTLSNDNEDICTFPVFVWQVIRFLPALLNCGILIVYSIGFTNELAKNNVSQTPRARKSASGVNCLDRWDSRKVNSTYGIHTDKETSVTMKSVIVSLLSFLTWPRWECWGCSVHRTMTNIPQ